MTKRNPNFANLKDHYLFPEINQRKKAFLAEHPEAKLISLGIGDTTEPLLPHITSTLCQGASSLGERDTYTGYGPEQGYSDLREIIAKTIYRGSVTPDEVFISDGAKCDIGRLQLLFGSDVSIALQDPAYPVYLDGSIMQGVSRITLLPCTPENDFFPDLTKAKGCDLLYFCSPNNPTGATATRQQLKSLVDFAREQRSIIIYDSAYSAYIQNSDCPKSIFEIEGAKEVALETSSFSKMAGFTGVRLGWTVVPKDLFFEDGSSVHKDWSRLISTLFNGASNIAQNGGLGVLSERGLEEVKTHIAFYLENARLLKEALENFEVYGGENAPYLWVKFPGKSSWEVFQEFLEELHLVTTPGSGFGPSGEGFLRFSAFSSRENVQKAIKRFSKISTFV